MWKVLTSLFFIATIGPNAYSAKINQNQNILDLTVEERVLEKIENFQDNPELYQTLIHESNTLSNLDDYQQFIRRLDTLKNINQSDPLFKKEKSRPQSSENNSDSLLEFLDEEDLPSPYNDVENDSGPLIDEGLLEFLDDDGKEVMPDGPVMSKNYSIDKPTYIITDDVDWNYKDYQGLKNVLSVHKLDDTIKPEPDSVIMFVINKEFDIISLIKLIDSVSEKVDEMYITTENNTLANRLSAFEKYTPRLKYIPIDTLLFDSSTFIGQ